MLNKLKDLTKKQLIISGFVSVVAIGGLSAGAFALTNQSSAASDRQEASLNSVNVSGAEDLIKNNSDSVVEAEQVVDEVTTTSPSPDQIVASPANTESPAASGNQETGPSADLDKRCELVNRTIDHFKLTYSTRGVTPSSQDILHDLNTSPMAVSARIYYADCVSAGKTVAL